MPLDKKDLSIFEIPGIVVALLTPSQSSFIRSKPVVVVIYLESHHQDSYCDG